MKRENPRIEICPGITRRTVAHGKNMYQMMATLDAGSTMPAHSHPQEQIVHILEGQMRLIVDGVPHELSTGDSFYLASNVPHGVETLLPTRGARYLQSATERLPRGRRKGSPRRFVGPSRTGIFACTHSCQQISPSINPRLTLRLYTLFAERLFLFLFAIERLFLAPDPARPAVAL